VADVAATSTANFFNLFRTVRVKPAEHDQSVAAAQNGN
jgi:hypothetical protein